MEFDPKTILGKKIILGFGTDENRLVMQINDSSGMTFLAGKEEIEIAEEEPIKIKITPGQVVCEEVGFVFVYQIFFKLGRHRFLTAISRREGELFVAYLPDEEELETGSSEFLEQCQK